MNMRGIPKVLRTVPEHMYLRRSTCGVNLPEAERAQVRVHPRCKNGSCEII